MTTTITLTYNNPNPTPTPNPYNKSYIHLDSTYIAKFEGNFHKDIRKSGTKYTIHLHKCKLFIQRLTRLMEGWYGRAFDNKVI